MHIQLMEQQVTHSFSIIRLKLIRHFMSGKELIWCNLPASIPCLTQSFSS